MIRTRQVQEGGKRRNSLPTIFELVPDAPRIHFHTVGLSRWLALLETVPTKSPNVYLFPEKLGRRAPGKYPRAAGIRKGAEHPTIVYPHRPNYR